MHQVSRRKKYTLQFCVVAALILLPQTVLGEPKQAKTSADSGFTYPRLELEGKLAKIFTVTNCRYISGMTCRIQYNGELPLPSQVFFTEFDERGQKAGDRVRLIYPNSGQVKRDAQLFDCA